MSPRSSIFNRNMIGQIFKSLKTQKLIKCRERSEFDFFGQWRCFGAGKMQFRFDRLCKKDRFSTMSSLPLHYFYLVQITVLHIIQSYKLVFQQVNHQSPRCNFMWWNISYKWVTWCISYKWVTWCITYKWVTWCSLNGCQDHQNKR